VQRLFLLTKTTGQRLFLFTKTTGQRLFFGYQNLSCPAIPFLSLSLKKKEYKNLLYSPGRFDNK
jgi:hypothetical protein